MIFSDDQLSKLLVETELVSQKELKEAQELSHRNKISLYDAIQARDLVTDEQLGRLTADFLSLPFVVLSRVSIPDSVLKIIPEIVAQKQEIIAFKKDKQGLHLAMAAPEDFEIREFVRKKVGVEVIPYFATKRDLNEAYELYRKGLKEEFSDIIKKSTKEAEAGQQLEVSVVKIVDTVISYANANKASDVHIEPSDDDSVVRFRIDGILHDVIDLPRSLHEQVVTRVKVMAELRTDEHQAAQDGKLQWPPQVSEDEIRDDGSDEEGKAQLPNEKIDIRVSIVPITVGEKVVMRLLSEHSRRFSLTDLGLSENDLAKVEQGVVRPHGMILATGPTGCGKTTTLYAVLKILNKRGVNIMTIEDPVEYDVAGVNQIQVNPKTNLTFAQGLRSVVRQDPDIILVGEIRDEETADIAVNSAMTGHLVLSTLHTNDASTAFVRLMDMGIEPFLISSTVNAVIAQRLVRKICIKCMMSDEVETAKLSLPKDLIKKYFGDKNTIRVYRGKGCDVCHHTGYVGRVGIFEVLEINENIQQAIHKKVDSDIIQSIAVESGMSLMLEDGLRKVQSGVTTVEEVLRVTNE